MCVDKHDKKTHCWKTENHIFLLKSFVHTSSEVTVENIESYETSSVSFITMRFIVMFVTAVCVLWWPKNYLNKTYVGNKSLASHGLYLLTFAVATACVAVGLHKLMIYTGFIAVTSALPDWTTSIFVFLVVSAHCKLKKNKKDFACEWLTRAIILFSRITEKRGQSQSQKNKWTNQN